MDARDFSIPMLLKMAHSPVRNYAIPGLTSSLIGAPSPTGVVRLFHSEREHQEPITPHSHRFDFQCWVLRGRVKNRIWVKAPYFDGKNSDLYMRSILTYGGEIGSYTKAPQEVAEWNYSDSIYEAGQCYSMKANDVHSIYFSRGALVLLFEGPQISDKSVIIEPSIDGETLPTSEVKPWMFKRGNK